MIAARLALLLATSGVARAQVACGLERVSYGDERSFELLVQHRDRQVPLIIENLTAAWQAHATWDPLEFSRRYGKLNVWTERQVAYGTEAESQDDKMSTLESMIAGKKPGRIALAFLLPFGDSAVMQGLRSDVSPVPTAFETLTSEPIFTLGRKDAGADFHAHTDIWSAQVRGHKSWLLAPPGTRGLPKGPLPCSILRARHSSELEQKLENCTVHPGEVLYLPAGWYHNTCNLDDFTIGVGGRGHSSAAHAACNYCDLAGLERAAEADPGSLHALDYYERQPLHACASVECLEGVKFLAGRGVNVSATTGKGVGEGDEGNQAMHLTYCNKPALAGPIVRVLVEHGADVQADSPSCGKVLHAAAAHGDLDMIRFLLKARADPTEEKFGATPLQLAERYRHKPVMRYLQKYLERRERRMSSSGGDL